MNIKGKETVQQKTFLENPASDILTIATYNFAATKILPNYLHTP